MLPTLNLQDVHLVNDRSLSFSVRMFNGAAVFHGMIHPSGSMFYRHLMVRTEGHTYETIPVFN